ncbi:hypothetical protein CM15mP35_03570 [bacterium]|nr:MAG: hypothetical protein CM15mP35_03570 [bacterium]
MNGEYHSYQNHPLLSQNPLNVGATDKIAQYLLNFNAAVARVSIVAGSGKISTYSLGIVSP